jgi:AraC family transcriptional activator of mar-sox-rob regulon
MLWSVSARIGEPTPWHAHDVFEFVCCQGGTGRLELDRQQIDFVRGRSIVVAPGVRHRYYFAPGDEADLKMVCMNAEDVASFLSPAHAASLASLTAEAASVADHPEDGAGLRAMLPLIPDGFGINEMPELRVIWGAISVLLALHGKHCETPDARSRRRHAAKIAEIRAWIEASLDDDIGLDQAASRFGLSRSLLTREFRRHTGKSFVDYCNTRRVERAALTLVSGAKSITEVALESGFANLSHFHRQFKNHYGLTPASFRRQITGMAEPEALEQAA